MSASATPKTDAAWNEWLRRGHAGRLRDEMAKLELELAEAHAQAYAYISEGHRTKDTLATVIPALEAVSGLKADEMRDNCPADIELTRNEWAALWMARAILERPS
jgi:hypothetical protein